MSKSQAIINADNVNKTYIEGDVHALVDLTLSIKPGEFVAISGQSGSGKSTLLNLIGTLDQPTSGTIQFEGIEMSDLRNNALADFRRENIGFVFQLFNLVPTLTVIENITLPLLPYRRKLDFNLEVRAEELLKAVGLSDKNEILPSRLSGGEQQRVAVARALINHPKLILADEPTGNLDSKTGQEIINLLTQLRREMNITILLVTHDAELAAQADRTIELKDGEIVQ